MKIRELVSVEKTKIVVDDAVLTGLWTDEYFEENYNSLCDNDVTDLVQLYDNVSVVKVETEFYAAELIDSQTGEIADVDYGLLWKDGMEKDFRAHSKCISHQPSKFNENIQLIRIKNDDAIVTYSIDDIDEDNRGYYYFIICH